MRFYIKTMSNAAPFFSDPGSGWVNGDTPEEALANAVKDYSHPWGLYSINLYEDANALHSGEKPLAKWRDSRAKKAWGDWGE